MVARRSSGDASGNQFGYRLHRRGEESYLVTVGGDTIITAEDPLFNAVGTHVAWGTTDGTVTLCDIQEVRRRLAAIGLGW
jgi:hypothetical protein